MAQADLDAMPVAEKPVVTAANNLVGYGESANDAENRVAAAAAGVYDAAYIGYDLALEAYEARSDIEDLTTKQTRNAPADFASTDFQRTVANDAPPEASEVTGI